MASVLGSELEELRRARGFNVREEDGLVLVFPSAQKRSRSDWERGEEWFRSLVFERESGRIVSVGFPKFFSLGECERSSERLRQALEGGEEVSFTEKLDGSLIIRSVVGREVLLRTRGTLDGGEHGQLARRIARERYGTLLDPDWLPGSSVLFELTSPEFRVVVPYATSELTLIGEVEHETLRLAGDRRLAELAAQCGAPLVPYLSLPRELDRLTESVEGLRGKEGVVARCAEGQLLVKLKSSDYLLRHRLKFSLSARAVRELCLAHDVRDLSHFERILEEEGVEADWELLVGVRQLVEAIVGARERARARLAELEAQVASTLRELAGERKRFACEYALLLDPPARAAAFALADGRSEQALTLLERAEVDLALRVVEELEQAHERSTSM
jgi:hypothetical protein